MSEQRRLASRIARLCARLADALARRRVPLGFACGALVLWLAAPTPATLAVGSAIAGIGEAIRIWAAGHLNKGREVTASGPYRWCAHPLYIGSSIIGAGLAVAADRIVVAALVTAYLGVTLASAAKREEASLRRTFGADYDRYRRDGVADDRRRFSVARAVANREHRALVGLLVAVLLLAWKATSNV